MLPTIYLYKIQIYFCQCNLFLPRNSTTICKCFINVNFTSTTHIHPILCISLHNHKIFIILLSVRQKLKQTLSHEIVNVFIKKYTITFIISPLIILNSFSFVVVISLGNLHIQRRLVDDEFTCRPKNCVLNFSYEYLEGCSKYLKQTHIGKFWLFHTLRLKCELVVIIMSTVDF